MVSKPFWVDNYAFRYQKVIPKLLIRFHDMKESFYELLYCKGNFLIFGKLIFLFNVQSFKPE